MWIYFTTHMRKPHSNKSFPGLSSKTEKTRLFARAPESFRACKRRVGLAENWDHQSQARISHLAAYDLESFSFFEISEYTRELCYWVRALGAWAYRFFGNVKVEIWYTSTIKRILTSIIQNPAWLLQWPPPTPLQYLITLINTEFRANFSAIAFIFRRKRRACILT